MQIILTFRDPLISTDIIMQIILTFKDPLIVLPSTALIILQIAKYS